MLPAELLGSHSQQGALLIVSPDAWLHAAMIPSSPTLVASGLV